MAGQGDRGGTSRIPGQGIMGEGRRKKENHHAGKAVAARPEGCPTENIAAM